MLFWAGLSIHTTDKLDARYREIVDLPALACHPTAF
jgi:hypothetical protein